jgi:hypothetical protein
MKTAIRNIIASWPDTETGCTETIRRGAAAEDLEDVQAAGCTESELLDGCRERLAELEARRD